jgi:hypothetical protein
MLKFMSLAAQYGFELEDMNFGNLVRNQHEQTVSQEYQAYVTAQCSQDTVDLLKFWEVDDDIYGA